jgi:glycosyltransferase involved in cell wall biosynthesis
MKKVLVIANHRYDRNPGQRFRFEQYFDFLRENGYDCHLSYIISEQDDKILYAKGKLPQKALLAVKAAFKRLQNVFDAHQYDIIFIFREAFFTGSILFEKLLKRSGAKIIFDFDDAIWNFDVSDANRKLSFLKNPEKTSKIIGMADFIFAGNQYLADYAGRYNENVVIIPTTIDTDEYVPGPSRTGYPICIGWSGSMTTISHFKTALPVLRRIKRKFGDQVTFKVVGDGSFTDEELSIQGVAWSKQDELKELRSMDIGIMPLPDDQWSKGKCGLKGLQYMALEIATVMSPVGVNADIIRDGENGMLAVTEDEWVEKLSQLIVDSELRKRLGKAGRKTVVERFSVQAQKNNYLRYFNFVLENKN